MKITIARLADVVLAPLTYLSCILLKIVRKLDIARMPISRKIFCSIGIFPIRDHYYEPMPNSNSLTKSLREDRYLPGIDLNVQEQLAILRRFDYSDELERFPLRKREGTGFYYHNEFFESGDAEYLYSMIRLHKPRRLVEIGGGFSTLIAREAIMENLGENPAYSCDHVCIEPYAND